MEDVYLLGRMWKDLFERSGRIAELDSAYLDYFLGCALEEREYFYGPDLVVESMGLSERLGNVCSGKLDCDPAHRELRMCLGYTSFAPVAIVIAGILIRLPGYSLSCGGS